MAKIRIAMKLDRLGESEVTSKGKDIAKALTDNAADYPGITPDAATIAAAVDEAKAAMTDAANKARAAEASTMAKKAALGRLKEVMTKAAKWMEANVGDEAKVVRVFPLRRSGTPASGIRQVMNLVLAFGAKGGFVVAVWARIAAARSYEVQLRYRDVTGSAWATVKILSPAKYAIPDLTSGQVVQVRVRAFGAKGIEGAWSDLAEHMVP
ncbi:MAG: fibronectin type III domain-containing protein [Chthoniobacteraceae bacterium]